MEQNVVFVIKKSPMLLTYKVSFYFYRPPPKRQIQVRFLSRGQEKSLQPSKAVLIF